MPRTFLPTSPSDIYAVSVDKLATTVEPSAEDVATCRSWFEEFKAVWPSTQDDAGHYRFHEQGVDQGGGIYGVVKRTGQTEHLTTFKFSTPHTRHSPYVAGEPIYCTRPPADLPPEWFRSLLTDLNAIIPAHLPER